LILIFSKFFDFFFKKNCKFAIVCCWHWICLFFPTHRLLIWSKITMCCIDACWKLSTTMNSNHWENFCKTKSNFYWWFSVCDDCCVLQRCSNRIECVYSIDKSVFVDVIVCCVAVVGFCFVCVFFLINDLLFAQSYQAYADHDWWTRTNTIDIGRF